MLKYQPGDINNDGFDDILIGEPGYTEPGSQNSVGQAYIFFMEINKRPGTITDISTFSDPEFSKSIELVDIDETVYVEVTGTDSDNSMKNLAEIYVKSEYLDPNGISVLLTETAESSGIFRGSFFVTSTSHQSHSWIGVKDIDELTLISVENPGLNIKLPVGPRIKIQELGLLDGDGQDGYTIYTGYKPYTIKINVNNALGCNDLDSVYLNWNVLDPLNSQLSTIRLGWHKNTDTFEIADAPEGWLSLYEPLSECIDGQNNYILFLSLYH